MLVLVAGIIVTVSGTWYVNRAVDRHEQAIVNRHAGSVAEAVRQVGEPIVEAVTLAMVLGAADSTLEGFEERMGSVVERNPLVRGVTIVEYLDGELEILAYSGVEPDTAHLDRQSIEAGTTEFETTTAYRDGEDVIVFAATFPIPGQPGRAVFGELAIQTDWLQLLAQDTARNVHLDYFLVGGDGEPQLLYSTGGEPSGASHTESVGLGSSDLVVVATAIHGTISSAEEAAPPTIAALGLLLTALAVTTVKAMDRRQSEVERLSVETQRLDAALSERLRIEQELAHRAYHDPLTGLPNRAWLIDRLHTSETPGPTAIFFLDLDGFKVVNDSLGHEVGDQLLETIAERLAAALDGEIITRFGGDEFVIMTFRDPTDEQIGELADRIRTAVSPALFTESGEVFVTASIGVRRIDGGHSEPEELLRDADAAMYAAKEMGRDRHVVFHPLVRDRAVERLRLDTGMRRALNADELQVEYQPIVDLSTGEMRGAEALVRWHHPDRGLLLPDQFLPILAETTLLAGLDEVVVHTAAQQLQGWLAGGQDVHLGVNLSAASLDRPDLVDFLGAVVDEYELAEGRLVLELTEKRLVDIADRGWIEQLRARGLSVGIDDFGTGYSSMAYLRDLPIDFLKLDRSFVEPLGRDTRTGTIVRTLVQLAGDLGVRTIAEGVETAMHAAILREFGCEFAQGTWFSPPLEADEIQRHMAASVERK